MITQKVCQNENCPKKFGRKYPNGYRFCPFCGQPLSIIRRTNEQKKWEKERDPLDIYNIPKFENKDPDTDRLI